MTNREWGDFPAATWSCLQAKTGRAPIYRYLFDYAPPAPQGEPRIARHGSELAYVFGTYRNSGNPQMGLVDDRTHALLSGYWVNFARTGNPSQPGLPWPAFTPDRCQTMVFDNDCRVVDDPEGEARKLLLT